MSVFRRGNGYEEVEIYGWADHRVSEAGFGLVLVPVLFTCRPCHARTAEAPYSSSKWPRIIGVTSPKPPAYSN